MAPVPDVDGFWLEVTGGDAAENAGTAARVLPLLAALLAAERERAFVAEELATRYEEIDLLYAISEILGQTVRLDQAAYTIVREVSAVVGARRASIMVFDEAAGLLRTVAARGFDAASQAPVSVDDPDAVSARVFREGNALTFDPSAAGSGPAWLCVPICYAAPGSPPHCVGVINLTDRIGGERFTTGDRKLVAAVANQIGAAIENARLVLRERDREALQRELELAHDLQLKLLPPPSVLQGAATVAARCLAADSVGGDFYTFTRLGRGRVGVMLGDVASHGFSAALVMALVMSAAGIHAAAAITPDETLAAMLESLRNELATTEMYFTVFYGVLDPTSAWLTYANAGHPYAWRIPATGTPERLAATCPPLGLSSAADIMRERVPWEAGDLLCLCTDGLVDAHNADGERFGEERLLARVTSGRAEDPDTVVSDVMAELAAFAAPPPADDRTLLLLRL